MFDVLFYLFTEYFFDFIDLYFKILPCELSPIFLFLFIRYLLILNVILGCINFKIILLDVNLGPC